MILIYTEGGKELGLGHLSRISPIYKYLSENGYETKVILFGDELAMAYLNVNNIPFTISEKYTKINPLANKKYTWLVDSTDIYNDEVLNDIKKYSVSTILLSPKFNISKCTYFTASVLRSDPYNLPIDSKFISSHYFIYNNSKIELDNSKFVLGIALSGGSNNIVISELVSKIINDEKIYEKVQKIKVFIGGSDFLQFKRKTKESFEIELEFISSLKSLWNYAENIDLMIVGNGILVDECIFEQKPFFIFNPDENNKLIIKSDFIKNSNEKYIVDFNNVTDKMSWYLNQNKKKSLNFISKPILNNMYLDKIISEIS
ncbi:hypothetical protein LDL76_16090 [Salegentibacter mishustinae]|uniref:hypothetical protein n=1 Tax=Salegentibacter mishustinae TaxID=270918 RepID=UPI001CE14DA2|nr:hypothetical protein [Salegentibacter mishustinae]UBZ06863.1 hypothetical protein LDL76_16090 [Salegentibacter mishustinae]